MDNAIRGQIIDGVLDCAVWYNVTRHNWNGESIWRKFISKAKYADYREEAERMVQVLRMSMDDKMRVLYGLITKPNQRDAEDLFEMISDKNYNTITKTEIKMLALYLNVNKNIETFLETEEFPRYPKAMNPGPEDSWFVKFASLPAEDTDLSQCMTMKDICETTLLRLLKNMSEGDGPAFYGKVSVWETLDESSIWKTSAEVREATVDGLENFYFQFNRGEKAVYESLGYGCPNIRFALYTRLYEKYGIGSKPPQRPKNNNTRNNANTKANTNARKNNNSNNNNNSWY